MSRHHKCPTVVYFYKMAFVLYTNIINRVILSLRIRQRNASVDFQILLPQYKKSIV
jgi:hypothetical protein